MANRELVYVRDHLGFSLNLDQSGLSPADYDTLGEAIRAAHGEMQRIEAGEIKNPDEGRRVTHFMDRVAYPGDVR